MGAEDTHSGGTEGFHEVVHEHQRAGAEVMKVVKVGTWVATVSRCESCDQEGMEYSQVGEEWQPVGMVQCNLTEWPLFLINLGGHGVRGGTMANDRKTVTH